MDLKQLRNFVAIVEHGTYLKAADALAISQPALSRSISNLETSNEAKVLDRTTRGLQMTPAGRRLYHRAKLILNEAEMARAELRRAEEEPLQFRIGVAPMFETTLLPDAIESFREHAPETSFQVVSGLYSDLANDLSEGTLDLVLSNIPFAPINESLTALALFDIDICCIVSAEHELARRADINFADAMFYPWAVIDEKNANDLYSYLFSSHGMTHSPIQLRTNALSLLHVLVQSPPWVCILPRHLVDPQLQSQIVKRIAFTDQKLSRKGGVLFRSSTKDDPRIKRFIEEVSALTTKLKF